MIIRMMVVTNNPMSKEGFSGRFFMNFIDGSMIDVLKTVRDLVHQGHKVLTHPLMSSIKPNETPYRTVLMTQSKEESVDIDSLTIIENSISSTEKFIRDFNIPNWNESVLKDFQLIDFDLVYHAVN